MLQTAAVHRLKMVRRAPSFTYIVVPLSLSLFLSSPPQLNMWPIQRVCSEYLFGRRCMSWANKFIGFWTKHSAQLPIKAPFLSLFPRCGPIQLCPLVLCLINSISTARHLGLGLSCSSTSFGMKSNNQRGEPISATGNFWNRKSIKEETQKFLHKETN